MQGAQMGAGGLSSPRPLTLTIGDKHENTRMPEFAVYRELFPQTIAAKFDKFASGNANNVRCRLKGDNVLST